MKQMMNSVAFFLGLFLVITAFTLSAPVFTHGQAPPQDVKVANTTSEPVPVTSLGTTNVRDLDHPARQPVHFKDFYTVPAGKVLVIEYISARIRADTRCSFISIEFWAGIHRHYFYPTYVGAIPIGSSNPGYTYGLSQGTRMYVDDNSSALLSLVTAGGCSPSITVDSKFASGYLVDKETGR